MRQGDQTYSAGDQATVQKWIVEKRLNRDGFICLDGSTWTPISEVETLQPFLQLVEQVQSLTPSGPSTLQAEAPPPEQTETTTRRANFAEVAELESLVDVDPPDTQDELDIDPFPTEEVPLPETPISANLAEFAPAHSVPDPTPSFEAPNTEEVNFDYPIHDDATLDSELIELPEEPELPSLEHALPMIEAEAPSFAPAVNPDPTEAPELAVPESYGADHALVDFPTEDELTLSEDDNDPVGSEAFASLDASWDEDDDDDLAWVNDKKRGRRIAAALLLTVLLLLTAKLFMDRRAEQPAEEEDADTIELAALPEDAIEVTEERPDATDEANENQEEAPDEAEKAADAPPPAAAPEPKPAPRATRSSSSTSSPAPNQQQLTQKAREAQTRRGPQPTTAADFVDRGRQAISQGDYNAARLYYLDAVDMEPSNAAANQGLAFAALQQGDIPFAIRHFCTTLTLTSPTSSMAQETQRALNELNAECP